MAKAIIPLIALVAATAAQAVPVKGIRESWGKADVSFDQYRADALACGRQGYYLDIADTAEAKAFVGASRQLDSMADASGFQTPPPPGEDPILRYIAFAAQQQNVMTAIRPEEKMRSLGKTMQTTVDQCLAARGYQKFRLTAAQTKRLSKLRIGSDERRQFLYSLARDPNILSAQAESPAQAATMSR